MTRAVEERSGGAPRSEKRLPQDPPAKANLDAEAGGAAATEKPNLDRFMWPRIYVSLSRKEKEDDFLAMKGTKLPQRPKKRAKNIDRSLQVQTTTSPIHLKLFYRGVIVGWVGAVLLSRDVAVGLDAGTV